MDTVKYEHHSGAMYVSALCPFKIKSATAPNHLTANWHRNPEIIYITGGEGTVQCGSESFLARTGDIFLINPETIHHITATDLLEYTFIIIDERFCRDNGIDLETCRFKPHVRDVEAESHIRRIMTFMTASSEKLRVFAARLRHAVLGLLIHLCVCHCESAVNASVSRSKSSELYVRNALLYISDNYSRPITIESIASSLGITKYHLSREFKRYTGETLVTHINKLRCRKAQLLIIRGYSVTEAALECGFESGSYFSQICKRITGLSPSEFKNGSAKGGYSDTFIDDGIDS